MSTNISSPIQAASRRRVAQHGREDVEPSLHQNGYLRDNFVVSDGDEERFETTDEDDDDAFEPIREAGKPHVSKKRELGPPIATDVRMDRLNPTHKLVVDEFVDRAKDEGDKVCPSKFETFL